MMLRRAVFTLAVVFETVCCGIPVLAQQTDLSTARPGRYRGAEGRRITVICQPGSKAERIWGTDVYTDDSSICTAAAHAGIVSLSNGGLVTAVIAGGRPSYSGSTRHGITSERFGTYAGSFTVEAGDGGRIDWITTARGVASLSKPVTLVCPPGGNTAGRIWGTDAYTEDTPICIAAVHAGLIKTVDGGNVVVQSGAGRASYRGTTRNGVTSLPFGSWPRSFRFEGAAEAVAESADAPARTKSIQPPSPTRTAAAPPTAIATTLPTDVPPGSGMTIGATVPGTPAVYPTATGFTVFAGYGRIQLDWKPVAGAKGYRLTRRQFNPTTLAVIPGTEIEIPNRPASSGGLITDTTFRDANVRTDVGYAYRLATFFEDRPGTVFTPASAVNPGVFAVPRDPVGMPWLPAGWETAPVITTTEIGQSQYGPDYTLAWNAKAGAIGYLILVEGIKSEYRDWFSSEFRDRLRCYFPNGLVPVADAVPGHTYLGLLPRVTAKAPDRYRPTLGSGDRYYSAFCAAVYAVYADAIDRATGTPKVSHRYNNPSLLMLPEGSVVSRPAYVMFRWIYPMQTGRYWEIVPPDSFSH